MENYMGTTRTNTQWNSPQNVGPLLVPKSLLHTQRSENLHTFLQESEV